MGVCGNKEKMSPEEEARLKDEKNRSKDLEKKMNKWNTDENSVRKGERESQGREREKDGSWRRTGSQVNKLLLLGAGESGKSTLFKQMALIYGHGFSEEDKRAQVSVIHNNILSSMKTLCEMSEALAQRENDNSYRVAPELTDVRDKFREIKVDDPLDQGLAEDVVHLWDDPGIQATYKHRNKFQLTDSAAYFFENVRRAADPNFMPSKEDILRSRVRTTGIVEQEFKIEKSIFKLFDVGGQRNERKKWIHCFSDVTAVLFVAALSEYDLVLFEDETTNRMEEALNLFGEICNSRWFTSTSMILFLNKTDLFKEKLTQVPLEQYFPDYRGRDFDSACDFVESLFEARRKDKKRQMYPHFTCATDTEQMRHIFEDVKDIIIRKSLAEGGLIV